MSTGHAGLEGGSVYLDYNATTPVDPRVVDVITHQLSQVFGNPSSGYSYGVAARESLAAARGYVSAFVGAGADDRLVFTGSGSEANALAIRGAVLARASTRRRHVITQATEHPATLAACDELRGRHGIDVTVLPVDGDGRLDPGDVAAAMRETTALVTVMHANNETGTIQPVAEIARIAHDGGALLHCDAAQSAGKLDVDVAALGADLLTVVGHKMYAPKGIAALHVARDVVLHPLVGGGGQEHGLRAGTENVAYAVGLARAAELAAEGLRAGETQRLQCLRDRLADRLQMLLPGRVHLNGDPQHRLPNTLNISIAGVRALTLLAQVPAVAASAGSACHAGLDTPSLVLSAMGIAEERALSAVRLSVGRWSTPGEVDEAAAQLVAVARR